MPGTGEWLQAVAFQAALFRWGGDRWVHVVNYGRWFWGYADEFTQVPQWYTESDAFADHQAFIINQPGSYRVAVRYHWWANRFVPSGSAWHWGGTHLIEGQPLRWCPYS